MRKPWLFSKKPQRTLWSRLLRSCTRYPYLLHVRVFKSTKPGILLYPSQPSGVMVMITDDHDRTTYRVRGAKASQHGPLVVYTHLKTRGGVDHQNSWSLGLRPKSGNFPSDICLNLDRYKGPLEETTKEVEQVLIRHDFIRTGLILCTTSFHVYRYLCLSISSVPRKLRSLPPLLPILEKKYRNYGQSQAQRSQTTEPPPKAKKFC